MSIFPFLRVFHILFIHFYSGDLAMKALAVPQEAVNRAQRAFDSAIGTLRSAQGKVQNARNRVANERRKIGGWRRKLDSSCRYKRCSRGMCTATPHTCTLC